MSPGISTAKILTAEDVLLVHEILVRDFAGSKDPILPAGVKDLGLLESAVGRQHVSFRGELKYKTPIQSAATLTYGVCNNHPFHNGNKRTALVAMLAHLDRNDLTLMGTQRDLFGMILAVATHSVVDLQSRARPRARGSKRKKTSGRGTPSRSLPDLEVAAIASWIQERARKPRRGEKQITFRELGRILRRFGFELCVPASGRGNHRDVIRLEEREVGLIRKRRETKRQRIGTIGYKDEGTFISIRDMKKIRELCGLREEDGVDSAAFYDAEAVIDAFVNHYRGVLNRLARR
jgi:death-on-curing protein